jgi:dipeptidyl aminopeptidase/acylaminoacyl peptidase
MKEKPTIKPESLHEYTWPSDPDIHHHNHWIAYVLKETNEQENQYSTNIYRVKADGEGTPQAITNGCKDSHPKWSPISNELAFLRVEQGVKQLWLANGINPESDGEPRLLFTTKRGIQSFVWSHDGKQIAYTTKVSIHTEDEQLTSGELGLRQHRQVYVRNIPKAEGSGWWDGLYTHLFIYDLQTKVSVRMTTGRFDVSQISWSLNNQQLAFIATTAKGDSAAGFSKTEQSYPNEEMNGLFLLNTSSKNVVQLVSSSYDIKQYSWSIQGQAITFVGNEKEYGSGTQHKLYTIAIHEPHAVVRISTEDKQLGIYVLNDMTSGEAVYKPADDEHSWYTIITELGTTQIWQWTAKTNHDAANEYEGKAFTSERWVIHQFISSPDRMFFVVQAITELSAGELYRIDVQTGEVIRLTNHNQKIIEQYNIQIPHEIIYQNNNQQALQGWVTLPSTATNQQQSIPLVLIIHGGPHAMYSPMYSHEFQALVAEGYAICFTNPRGSFGYGQDIAQGCRSHIGVHDYEDLMDFVDVVLEQYPCIDKQRIGVMGGSYGGLMTNWIVGHTNRFKAAVSQRSISNWLSFYGNSDIGISYTEGMIGSNPWGNTELLWRKSPIAHVQQVDTPILIMHGEQDLRCPIEQADQWYAALKRCNKTAKLIRYANCNHSFQKIGKPSLRIDVLKQVNAWFNSYMREPIAIGIPFAMLLENARSSGAGDERILKAIIQRDFSGFQEQMKESDMDILERLDLANELSLDWEAAIKRGYSIHFLHTNALKRLLSFRYGFKENVHYRQEGYHLFDVPLLAEQVDKLNQIIHVQWVIEESTKGYSLKHKGFMNKG